VNRATVEADRAALDGIIDESAIRRLLSRAEEMIRESWSEIESLRRDCSSNEARLIFLFGRRALVREQREE
jgi:hypothetical protein